MEKLTTEVFDSPDCPGWVMCAAIDKNGEVWGYAERPHCGLGIWVPYAACTYLGHVYDASNWENSLIERPSKLSECNIGASGESGDESVTTWRCTECKHFVEPHYCREKDIQVDIHYDGECDLAEPLDSLSEDEYTARSGVLKYRKKPVIVEAIQWVGSNAAEVSEFVGTDTSAPTYAYFTALHAALRIQTLEGVHKASIGDFIVKGVAGECYPCKPDIFAATYEQVQEKEDSK